MFLCFPIQANVHLALLLSSEINTYQKQTQVISITRDNGSDIWIISDYSIHLMHFTSELQTHITFVFMNVYAFS